MLEISWTNPSNSDSSQIYAETSSCEARKLSPQKMLSHLTSSCTSCFKKTNLLTFMLIKYITYNFFLNLNFEMICFSTVSLWNLDLGSESQIQPHLKRAQFYQTAMEVAKMGSILKSNPHSHIQRAQIGEIAYICVVTCKYIESDVQVNDLCIAHSVKNFFRHPNVCLHFLQSKIMKKSISSAIYEQLFCTKVTKATFLYLHFSFLHF